MTLFAAVPRSPVISLQLDERMRGQFDTSNSLRLDLGVWIISATGTATEVAEKLKILNDESPLSVIIFSLTGSYTGRAPTDVWDWMKAAVERRADG